MTHPTEKKRVRRPKSLPVVAWDWRRRRIPGAYFATLVVVEEAFVAGVRWERRRAKR